MIRIKGGALWQWDNNRIVEVILKAGCTVSEIHFFNGTTDNALNGVVGCAENIASAEIPNIFLQVTNDISVYAVVDDVNGKRTTERAIFGVMPKEKPADYVYTETELLTYKALENRIDILEKGGVTEEQIANAINEYLEKNPIQNTASTAKIGYVTLLAEAWNGEDNLYSQIVTVEGVTENSQVDLTPSAEQLSAFHSKDLTFVTKNKNGVVTVYAIGQKPLNDYTIQVTITEVQK